MTRFYYTSPLGMLDVLCGDNALHEIRFVESADTRDTVQQTDISREVKRWLDTYFSGKVPDFMPPLKPLENEFRQSVWRIVLGIPYGQTMTYGEIAKIIAAERNLERMSAQAVGGAVGRNPIPIIIPCHRVIGASGRLVGYTGGLDKKVKLLGIEGSL